MFCPLGELPFFRALTPNNNSQISDFDIRAKPSHYDLSIHDIEFGGSFTYQGTVAIKTKIDKKDGFTDLVVNTHQLKLHSAELKTTEGIYEAKDISYEEKRHRATFDFGRDRMVDFALKLAFRTFNFNEVTLDLHFDSAWYGDRIFTNA